MVSLVKWMLLVHVPFFVLAQTPEILIQNGHSATARSVALSPGGMTLASASDDNTVKLRIVASGKLLRSSGRLLLPDMRPHFSQRSLSEPDTTGLSDRSTRTVSPPNLPAGVGLCGNRLIIQAPFSAWKFNLGRVELRTRMPLPRCDSKAYPST